MAPIPKRDNRAPRGPKGSSPTQDALLFVLKDALLKGQRPLTIEAANEVAHDWDRKMVDNTIRKLAAAGKIRAVVMDEVDRNNKCKQGFTAHDNPHTAKWPNWKKGASLMQFPGFVKIAQAPTPTPAPAPAPAPKVTELPYMGKDAKRKRMHRLTAASVEVLNMITEFPGLMAPDYEQALERKPHTLWYILDQLTKKGLIFQEGAPRSRRFYPAGYVKPKAAANPPAEVQAAAAPVPEVIEVPQQVAPSPAPIPALVAGTDISAQINGIAAVIADALVNPIMAMVMAKIEDFALDLATRPQPITKAVASKRPRVLVLGLRDKDAGMLIREFPSLELLCVTADSSQGAARAVESADHVLALTDFINHSQEGQVKHHPNYKRLTGGLSTMRNALQGLTQTAQH